MRSEPYQPVARPLQKFLRNQRDYGAGVALHKAGETLLAVVFLSRVYRVYRIDLRTWTAREPAPAGLAYRFVKSEERGLTEQVEAMEEWLARSVSARLRKGALCLAAMDGLRVAGFNLVSFGTVYIPLIERQWTFRACDAWSEQITVGPAYRGRGIASELRFGMFRELKARGIRRFYGGALRLNTGSLRLARHVGFSELFDVHFRRSWGYRRFRCTRVGHDD